MTAPAAARKNQWGARTYPIPRPGSEDVEDLPSVTHLLKILAAPGLEIWKQKMLAEQFALRPDLVMLAANPDTRYDAIKQALDAGRSASNTGTALHHFSEQVDAGEVIWSLVPDVAKPWVEQYQAAKDRYGWKLVRKEFTVYNHTAGYAGTADRILWVPDYGNVIADLKTGASVYGDHALQCKFYASGEGVWTAPAESDLTEFNAANEQLQGWIANNTNVPPGRRKWSVEAIKQAEGELAEAKWREYARKGTHSSLPDDLRQDVALIIHLSEKGCELVPLDLTGTYEVITGIAATYHWQQRKDVVGEPVMVKSAAVMQHPADSEKGQDGSDRAVPAEDIVSEEPVPFSPAPAVKLDASTRRASLQARIDALSAGAKTDLVFKWPADTPTLKKWDGHSPAQLQAIEDVLWGVESEHGLDKLLAAFPDSSVINSPKTRKR